MISLFIIGGNVRFPFRFDDSTRINANIYYTLSDMLHFDSQPKGFKLKSIFIYDNTSYSDHRNPATACLVSN